MDNVSVLYCTTIYWNVLCTMSAIMVGLTGVSLIIAVLCFIRLVFYFKSLWNFPLAIHYIILLEVVALLVYFSVYGQFWLHTLYESLQLFTFVVVVFFFFYKC